MARALPTTNIFFTGAAAGAGLLMAILLYKFFPSTTTLYGSIVLAALPVVVTAGLPKLRKKLPSGGVDLDLTYLIQHMLAVSTGKPPRKVLFDVVSNEPLYPKYREIFRKIYVLGKEWGYSFTDACRLVSREVRNRVLKEFLVRLGSVLAVGEDVELFLKTEYMTILSEYETLYNRIVDAARVFLGIHSSMLAASVFMLANFLLLAFFFGGGTGIIVLSFSIVTVTIASIAILLFVLLPKDAFENKLKPKPRFYVMVDYIAIIGIILSIVLGYVIIGKNGLNFTSLALSLMASGVIFLPAGILAKTMERRIRDIDDFFPIFIRSYGMHLQTVPQMARALKPLLAAELGKLNKLLENLYSRLLNEIDPRIAWRLFSAESGSELVRRSIRIFLDTVEKGGRVAEVGAMLSDHHNTIVRLRRAKFQVGKTFETTTYMMHMAIILITVFITTLMQGFSQILSSVQAQLPGEIATFFFTGALPLGLLVKATGGFVVATTFFNALSIARALPGVSRSFWYYYALLSIIGGAAVIAGQQLLNFILSSTIETLNQTLIAPPV